MSNPLVSVIVPVYNTENYLKKCIESILVQSHKNIELWLIDDDSSDGSLEICRAYEVIDKRVTVIHKNNEGQGVARNTALELCKGEYIAFVDSDDSVRESYIEDMLKACLTYNAALCVCGYSSDSGVRIVDHCPTETHLNSDELMYSYLTSKDIGGFPWNKLYHKKIFDNLSFPNLRANEDAYIMPDIIRATDNAVVIKNPNYIQYIRSGSTERSKFSEKKMALLTADRHLIKIVVESFPQYEFEAHYKYTKSIVAIMQAIIESDDAKYKPKLNELYDLYVDEMNSIKHNKKYKKIDKKKIVMASSYKIMLIFLKCDNTKKQMRSMIKKLYLKIKGNTIKT